MNDQTDAAPKRDHGFIAILSLLVLVAAWLLLMPVVPSIASSTMHRFHLRTSSFAWWVAQFPIPPMYNFANRYETSDIPPGFVDPILESREKRYINHFPARVLTFANGRYQHLHHGTDRWLTIESSYRGQQLKTRFHAEPKEGNGFRLIRLPPEEAR